MVWISYLLLQLHGSFAWQVMLSDLVFESGSKRVTIQTSWVALECTANQEESGITTTRVGPSMI